MDSHNLEPQELNDRIRLYSHKLSQQWGTLQEDSISAANGRLTFLYTFQTISQFISLYYASMLQDY